MTDVLVKALQQEFPESPIAECLRFAHASEVTFERCKKSNKANLIQEEATKKLEAYHDWRHCYGIDFEKPALGNDDDIWRWAVKKALSAANAKKESKRKLEEAKKAARSKPVTTEPIKVDYDSFLDNIVKDEEGESNGTDNKEGREQSFGDHDESDDEVLDNASVPDKGLPQIIFQRNHSNSIEPTRDKDGNAIFHLLAARIDQRAADSETWALAIALYLDCHFHRNSTELYSLFIDVRAGQGWANPRYIMSVSLTRAVIKSISDLHPGRWNSIVIFPLPFAFLGIWRTVKSYLHAENADVVHLISGPSHLGSQLPKALLEPFVEIETLDYLEQCRNERCCAIVEEDAEES